MRLSSIGAAAMGAVFSLLAPPVAALAALTGFHFVACSEWDRSLDWAVLITVALPFMCPAGTIPIWILGTWALARRCCFPPDWERLTRSMAQIGAALVLLMAAGAAAAWASGARKSCLLPLMSGLFPAPPDPAAAAFTFVKGKAATMGVGSHSLAIPSFQETAA
jgi:hypothetical protein